MRLPADAAQSENNWDSYNAVPTTPEAIAAAENLTTWMPMAHGGIMLEAVIGDSEVTIEIDADGNVEGVNWNRS